MRFAIWSEPVRLGPWRNAKASMLPCPRREIPMACKQHWIGLLVSCSIGRGSSGAYKPNAPQHPGRHKSKRPEGECLFTFIQFQSVTSDFAAGIEVTEKMVSVVGIEPTTY